MDDNKSLLTFPCRFPIKIIGLQSDAFLEEIQTLAKAHFPDFVPKDMRSKPSKEGRYLAVTLDVEATSQAVLDAFYSVISKLPAVKMAL